MKKIYRWKIFKKSGDDFCSMSPPPCCIFTYNKNEWNITPIGGFLLFKTRDAARKYKPRSKDYILKKVEVQDPVDLPIYRCEVESDVNTYDVFTLWESNKMSKQYWYYGYWPFGTEAYKKLKIVPGR